MTGSRPLFKNGLQVLLREESRGWMLCSVRRGFELIRRPSCLVHRATEDTLPSQAQLCIILILLTDSETVSYLSCC